MYENLPLVSVIIPCYNAGRYVEEAVESILNQTYKRLEIIAIDDGSTDDTKDILRRLQHKDNRLNIIENGQNLKLVNTLNKGLYFSNGDFVARMDADDIALPSRIEKQVEFLYANPDVGLLGTFIEEFGEDTPHSILKQPTTHQAIYSRLFVSSPFFHPSVMMRKKILSDYSLQYENQYYRAEDYALWVKMSQYTKMANIPEVLLKYRILSTSETRLSLKNDKQKHVILKSIYKLIMNQNDILLTDEELDQYTFSMYRNNMKYLDLKKLKAVYNKVLSSFADGKSVLKFELARRWIGAYIYGAARLKLNVIFLGIFSSYSYLGIYKILKDKGR